MRFFYSGRILVARPRANWKWIAPRLLSRETLLDRTGALFCLALLCLFLFCVSQQDLPSQGFI